MLTFVTLFKNISLSFYPSPQKPAVHKGRPHAVSQPLEHSQEKNVMRSKALNKKVLRRFTLAKQL